MASKLKMAFGGVIKSLHQLWLQITGTFLIAFAAAFGYHAIKEYRTYLETSEGKWGVITAASFALMTLGFGIHSFWKARKLH